uniref:Protein kinase domain-containing protein n=1 Tax=Caenorhabditis tropicalis TaxID=1561998 RepID=A0A1I7U7W1_9PELO
MHNIHPKNDCSFSPAVQSAPAVERRTHTNLFSHDQYETDISETQSDFVSSRRKNRLFSDEDDQDSNLGSGQYLAAPVNEARRSASPSLYTPPDHLRGYQSSKSMMNLRDVTGGVRVQTAKELMMSHIASQRNSQSGSSSHLSSTNTSGRMKWGDMPQSSNNNDWHPSSTVDIHHVTPVMATSMAPPPQQHQSYGYRDHGSTYPMPDSNHPPPLAPRTTSRVLTAAPSQQALQQIQAQNSPFRRKSMDRNSLSKKFLENGGTQPKTVWSPSALATSSTPRRSNSNLFAATNLEVPPISTNLSRRPDDLNFASSLRSRSQSPNKLALSQMMNSRDTPSSPSSTTGSSIVGRGGYQQRRRDSDVSYVRSATRGRDEMRKSTDALNKLMAVRSKLHQSSENLRKSTENLALLKNLEEASNHSTPKTRTRSSSNLRNGEILGNMESFGTFDADSRMRSGSTSSLAHSRMMARSIGNLNENLAMEGSNNFDSPSQRLANTIQMMRKASNPDLTAPEQFEDTGSPFAQRMARGAVQKKMERYRAKNKTGGSVAGRNQTSEESDSNNSDMMPLSINKRALTAGNRSTTGSDFSPASSRGSSSLAMGSGPIGSGLPSSRRLYDQQRSGLSASGTPRRTGNNYLVTKMSEQMNKSMEGPDLGSDESPRSSVNSHEWQNLMENSQDGTKNPLICHVQDCMEQLRIHVDKSLQAKKLVEDDSSLAIEQKKIVMCEIDRSIERLIEKLAPNQISSKSNDRNNGNVSVGNDYTPKGANIYGILKENLSSRQ